MYDQWQQSQLLPIGWQFTGLLCFAEQVAYPPQYPQPQPYPPIRMCFSAYYK